jgi:hypothetical protein
MREKLLWVVCVIILGLVCVAYGQRQAPAPATGEVGRYQLVVRNSGDGAKRLVYRLDTRTGRTWVEAQMPLIDGNFTPRWALIQEGSDKP